MAALLGCQDHEIGENGIRAAPRADEGLEKVPLTRLPSGRNNRIHSKNAHEGNRSKVLLKQERRQQEEVPVLCRKRRDFNLSAHSEGNGKHPGFADHAQADRAAGNCGTLAIQMGMKLVGPHVHGAVGYPRVSLEIMQLGDDGIVTSILAWRVP